MRRLSRIWCMQVAAETLGWDQHSWDGGKRVRACRLSWLALGPRQREAAETLGFHQQSWEKVWKIKPSTAAAAAAFSSASGSDATPELGRGVLPRLSSAELSLGPAAESAIVSALRRLVATEGADRFESLSLRDLRLQLPASLALLSLEQRAATSTSSGGVWSPGGSVSPGEWAIYRTCRPMIHVA